MSQKITMLPLDKVSRVEVINHIGPKSGWDRDYVYYLPEGTEADVEIHLQDEGRTLKVFINKKQS